MAYTPEELPEKKKQKESESIQRPKIQLNKGSQSRPVTKIRIVPRRIYRGNLSGAADRINSIVKCKYIPNNADSHRRIGVYINYIKNREMDQEREGNERQIFGKRGQELSQQEALERIVQNRGEKYATFNLIVSPGDNSVDLKHLTLTTMQSLETKLNRDLEYVFVIHKNTSHHHAHVVLGGRGIDRLNRLNYVLGEDRNNFRLDKSDLRLMREASNNYIDIHRSFNGDRMLDIDLSDTLSLDDILRREEAQKYDRIVQKELGLGLTEYDKAALKELGIDYSGHSEPHNLHKAPKDSAAKYPDHKSDLDQRNDLERSEYEDDADPGRDIANFQDMLRNEFAIEDPLVKKMYERINEVKWNQRVELVKMPEYKELGELVQKLATLDELKAYAEQKITGGPFLESQNTDSRIKQTLTAKRSDNFVPKCMENLEDLDKQWQETGEFHKSLYKLILEDMEFKLDKDLWYFERKWHDNFESRSRTDSLDDRLSYIQNRLERIDEVGSKLKDLPDIAKSYQTKLDLQELMSADDRSNQPFLRATEQDSSYRMAAIDLLKPEHSKDLENLETLHELRELRLRNSDVPELTEASAELLRRETLIRTELDGSVLEAANRLSGEQSHEEPSKYGELIKALEQAADAQTFHLVHGRAEEFHSEVSHHADNIIHRVVAQEIENDLSLQSDRDASLSERQLATNRISEADQFILLTRDVFAEEDPLMRSLETQSRHHDTFSLDRTPEIPEQTDTPMIDQEHFHDMHDIDAWENHLNPERNPLDVDESHWRGPTTRRGNQE